MNKLYSKIAALSVGLAMAIGVGVAVGSRKAVAVKADSVTMAYSGSTTNMGEGNNAASVGLSATDWTVTASKGGNSNYPGLNKSGYIAMYYNATESNSIVVAAINSSWTVDSITITFTGGSYSNVAVYAGSGHTGTAITGSDGVYNIDDSAFTLYNANTSNVQVRISSVVINYSEGSGPVTTKYTVTYDANGGTVSPASELVVENGHPSLPTPTYAGHDFDGWQVNGEGDYVTGEYVVTGNVTLVAHWTEKSTTGYAKITDLSKASKVIITTAKSGVNYYLPAATNTNSAPSASTCTIVDGVLTGVEDSNLFDVAIDSDGHYKFTNSDGSYLYIFNNNNGIRIGSTADSFVVTPTENGYSMQDVTNSRFVGIYLAQDWRSYTTVDHNNYKGTDDKFSSQLINFYGIQEDVGTLTKIELSGEYKTEFKQGETFTHAGMVVTATYSSSAVRDVTSAATWSGYDLSVAGAQTVTVSYTEGGVTKTASYSITVKESVALTAEDVAMEVGDADYAPVVKVLSTSEVINGCTFSSSNESVATIVDNKIHAVGRGTATITAAHADVGNVSYTSAEFVVTVSKLDTVEDIYSMSANANTVFNGYYAGTFSDGIIVMDGEYGILVYKATAESTWEVDETVLHVEGQVTIYNNLFEIKAGATVSVLTDASAIAKLSKPTNYTLSGTESADNLAVANRRTFVSGEVASVTAAGSNFNVVIGSSTLYLKAADNVEITLQDESTMTISAYLTSKVGEKVTVKGFTSFFTNFQVRVYGIVEQDTSYTAEEFAQQLLDETDVVCSVWDGKSSNKEALTSIWNYLGGEDRWQALSEAEQANFTEVDPDYTGTSDEVLEKAAGRYDMLCKKYFQSNNFAGRDFSEAPVYPENARFASDYSSVESNSLIIVISAIAATSAIALGALILIKKRKHN